MCEKCVAAVHKYFPKVSDDDIGDLLFSATCFPFGDHTYVARQLRNLARRKRCDGTVATAAALADADMDRAMRHLPPGRTPMADRRQMTTKYRLTLMSGVHPANNNEVGDFVDERTARLVGSLLLAIDANYQPEYCGYDLEQVTDERLPPNV